MWGFMMIGVKGKQLCAGNPNAPDGRTEGRTDRLTDGHCDSSIPPLTSLWGGIKIIVCLWNTMPPVATKSQKIFFASRSKSRSQGHYFWTIRDRDFIFGMLTPLMTPFQMTPRFIAKVKVDNRQTDRQTDKQTGQKQYAPDHSIRGHKNMSPSGIWTRNLPLRKLVLRPLGYTDKGQKWV